MDIRQMKISELAPYERNARTHSTAQITSIARSIKQFGFNNPILIDGKRGIIAGHGRLMAARELGLTEVPVIELTHLSEAQKRAYIIADNQLALQAGWDSDILRDEITALLAEDFDTSLLGFDEKELTAIMAIDDDGKDEPEPDLPPIHPQTRKGDVWIMGHHRLICGDCTDPDTIKVAMDGRAADCVFTSPPYGVGIDYGSTYEDSLDALRESLPKIAATMYGLLVDGGYAVINFGDIVSKSSATGAGDDVCEYPMALEYWPAFRGAGFNLWTRRIWVKPGATSNHCISSNRAMANWEHVWTWIKPGKPIINHQLTDPYPSQAGWFDSLHDHATGVDKDTHGAVMPVPVALRCVVMHSRINSVVVEPFCGSGTTILACERARRRCVAFEINPAYVDVAVARWIRSTGNEVTRESDGAEFKFDF